MDMKRCVCALLAHVDAGKTTLSESMLYLSGAIRQYGRVDHKDAFLDYDTQEKNRGITIFSKQARFAWKELEVTLLDTPGHVDFGAEMERTLQVLDYAVLIVSGVDGVQSHTETIWKLLAHYQIPTFIFVNKMDLAHESKENLLTHLEQKLSSHCVDFSEDKEECMEKIAMQDEELLEKYIDGCLQEEDIALAIQKRKLFPCYFGSALKRENIVPFLDMMEQYVVTPVYEKALKARVYKVTHDANGQHLTHLKVTGGFLKVKSLLPNGEKIDQIRQYSGEKYHVKEEVHAGEICTLKGVESLVPGEVIGEEIAFSPMLMPYMQYRMRVSKDCDSSVLLGKLKQLASEDPLLQVEYREREKAIYIQMMGEIQIEILKTIIKERFQETVEFDAGDVIYKETIAETVEGVGHYEPLRHYSEVHILLEPLPRGSGLQFESICKEEVLAKNWQRLVLSHMEEKTHLGVLIGAPITDIKCTLVSGKAHLKHTEGGDFREATYRAIRQGLKKAKSILLEPYFQYRLEIPAEYLSRAIYDIEAMHGDFKIVSENNETCVLHGEAPIKKMQNYATEVLAYTKGKGKLYCSASGYKPCEEKESEAIIQKVGYDSESDLQNPTGSIFCEKGSGFYVKWDEVQNYMHIKEMWKPERKEEISSHYRPAKIDDKEVQRVYESIYGKSKPRYEGKKPVAKAKTDYQKVEHKPLCLLVDGYNIIHSWPELQTIAETHLDAARERLIDLLSSYQGFKKCLLILVFDAYKVEDGLGSSTYNGSIHIVYTKKAQTADSYIEKATHDLSKTYQVCVATSDGMEQLIILGQNAYRMSARELLLQVENMHEKRMKEYGGKTYHRQHKLLEDIKKYEGNEE